MKNRFGNGDADAGAGCEVQKLLRERPMMTYLANRVSSEGAPSNLSTPFKSSAFPF